MFARIVGGVIDIGSYEYQGLDPVWVDFAFGGTELGTPLNPFNTLGEGAGAAIDGATVNLAAGSSPETVIVSVPVTLQSTGGTVTIGASGGGFTMPKSETGFVVRD